MGPVELANGFLDPERGANGALGVVLVDGGRAEDADDGVAYELLDNAAEALYYVLECSVVGAERGLYVLWVGPVRALGEPDKVSEERGDDLALFASRLGFDAGATVSAEGESLGEVATAGIAAHGESLGPAGGVRVPRRPVE